MGIERWERTEAIDNLLVVRSQPLWTISLCDGC